MTSRSVVIVGPSLGHYPESVARGFTQNGIVAWAFSYPAPPENAFEDWAWWQLPKFKISAPRTLLLERLLRQVTEASRTADLLIVIRGDALSLSQFDRLRRDVKCPTVLWLMDSLDNVEDSLQRAGMADALLFFEGTDAEKLMGMELPCHQVSLAADADWYYPIQGASELWDFSFLGRLYNTRLASLESILQALPTELPLTGCIVGPYKGRVRRLTAARRIKPFPLTRGYLKHAQNWPHPLINRLNNESRVCLNLFHSQSLNSLNMRTFETCCSGAFLLCQDNAALPQAFSPGIEVETFCGPEEGADKLAFYLRNDAARKKIAAAGRERVLRDHTMRVRVREIWSLLEADGLV